MMRIYASSMRGGAMRLPIDTSRLQFLVVAPAEPLKQFEEGKPREAWAPRVDTTGAQLWRVQLVALGDGEAEIIRVAVPGDPNVSQGEMVRVESMTAQAWDDGGPQRHGLPGHGDPPGRRPGGEGRGRMVRALVTPATVGRIEPMPFRGEGTKPI